MNRKLKQHSFGRYLLASFALLLFIGQSPVTKAQTPLADASRELRKMFAPVVNPNTDVRFFYDMAAHIVDSNYFNHLVYSDTNDVNNWYRLYEEMGYMAYDTTILISQDSVMNLADPFVKNDTFPLAIMDFKYNLLKPGVLDTNIWFDFDTSANTLSDQASSPYEPVQNVFNCAALDEGYEYTNPVFMVNPAFIFTDPPPPGCNTCSKLAYSLKIDFEDGTGYHTFSSDTTAYYQPTYSIGGAKIISFILDSAGTMMKYSKALFNITGTTALKAADSIWHLPGIRVSLFGGCESTMQKKFVIYLSGLDVLEDTHGPQIYEDMIKGEGMEALQNLGYTFLVVDWDYSYRDIAVNAMSVVGLIDTLKARYPALPPLVVVGHSMGGLVGRYALRWMETSNYLHDQTHPHLLKMHNTRLFITLDAPQRGANIPLAYQWLYRYVHYVPLFRSVLSPTIFHKLTGGYAPVLNAPAVKQMLLYHINSDPLGTVSPISTCKYEPSHYKGDLDADFMAMGNDGWPEYCKKVAQSNGSWRGDRQERAWDNGYRVANDDFLKMSVNGWVRILGKKVAGVDMGFALRSNPDGDGEVFQLGYNTYIYKVKISRWKVKVGLTKTTVAGISKNALDCRPYCVSAGSNNGRNFSVISAKPKHSLFLDVKNIFGVEYSGSGAGIKVSARVGFPLGIFGIDYNFEARSDASDFGFIPTGSSFAYTEFETESLDHPIIGDSVATIMGQTPYDVVITNPTHHFEFTTKTDRLGNRNHLWVENNFREYNDFVVCSSPSSLTLRSRILNREIGDDSLYLENTSTYIPFTIEAYKGLFVNIHNPHYNYPSDTAKYASYVYRDTGSNGNGSIVLSKDNPYRTFGMMHTFKYNDTFSQVGLEPWEYNPIPSAMFPCCIDFSLARRGLSEANTDTGSTILSYGQGYFKLYPNPATNAQKLRVAYSFAHAGWAKAELYNALGQKIAEQNYHCAVPNAICSFELPLAMLQSGLYILRIGNGEEQHQGKFIVTP